MRSQRISRRKFLRVATLTAAGTAVVACQPQTVVVEKERVVKETVVVEKEKVVKETVVVQKEVMVTPLPTPSEEKISFNLDATPLQTACLYGAGVSMGVFLLFGFMAALRNLIYAIFGQR